MCTRTMVTTKPECRVKPLTFNGGLHATTIPGKFHFNEGSENNTISRSDQKSVFPVGVPDHYTKLIITNKNQGLDLKTIKTDPRNRELYPTFEITALNRFEGAYYNPVIFTPKKKGFNSPTPSNEKRIPSNSSTSFKENNPTQSHCQGVLKRHGSPSGRLMG